MQWFEEPSAVASTYSFGALDCQLARLACACLTNFMVMCGGVSGSECVCCTLFEFQKTLMQARAEVGGGQAGRAAHATTATESCNLEHKQLKQCVLSICDEGFPLMR